MHLYRRAVSHRMIAFSICSTMALILLFAAPEAMGQGAGQNAAAPSTTAPNNGNPFSRLFRMPSAQPATAAPPAAQPERRVRKPRISKSRKRRPKPVAAESAPVEKQPPAPARAAEPVQESVADSGWPSAAEHVGGVMIAPLTVKTVREQLEPEPEALLVSDNELNDIDRAARISHAEAAEPEPTEATDGSGAIENELAGQARVVWMSETIKTMMQLAWVEPVLLMIAGSLAGLAAARVFT